MLNSAFMKRSDWARKKVARLEPDLCIPVMVWRITLPRERTEQGQDQRSPCYVGWVGLGQVNKEAPAWVDMKKTLGQIYTLSACPFLQRLQHSLALHSLKKSPFNRQNLLRGINYSYLTTSLKFWNQMNPYPNYHLS